MILPRVKWGPSHSDVCVVVVVVGRAGGGLLVAVWVSYLSMQLRSRTSQDPSQALRPRSCVQGPNRLHFLT